MAARKQDMQPWRELAARLGRSPRYAIELAATKGGTGKAADMARRQQFQLQASALKILGAQDVGHPQIQAREKANQAPAVIEARAHVLYYDHLRDQIGQEIAQRSRERPLSRAQIRTRQAKIRELDGLIQRYSREEITAFEAAYKSELRKIPKAPRLAPRKPKKEPYKVYGYTPLTVSVGEIAMARRNPRVLELERDMSRLGTELWTNPNVRAEYEATAEAYYRARDREVQAIRAEQSGEA